MAGQSASDTSLESRWRAILERVKQSCQRAKRDPNSVTLVAVSKKQPIELIQQAYDLGIRDFGENYVQELTEKREQLPSDIRWHFIGPLQSNKIKLLGEVALIHSVDRLSLCEELAKKSVASGSREVLVQVNLSNEVTKHGFSADGLKDSLATMSSLKGIKLRGLMTMPPPVTSPEQNRVYFRQLRECAAGLERHLIPPIALSMGMSDDFEVAIEEGATHIRVGTLLFGDRQI